MRTIDLLQWSSCFLSVAGAFLTACVSPHLRLWGFLFFLAANIVTATWAIRGRHHGILVAQAVFTLTSLIGIWNHWGLP